MDLLQALPMVFPWTVPREIIPQCLVVLYHMGVLVESLVKVPMMAITRGGNNNGGPGGGMTMIMGMIMMVHPSHRHHQRLMPIRRRTRRRRQAMEGEEEMMILTRNRMTAMKSLFDV